MESEVRPLRCVIVDDSPAFLDAATKFVGREGITVVGVASNVAEALDRVASLRPDVTLVDVVLGAESGFDLAERLSHRDICSPVILTSTHSEQDLEDAIATSPALGFVSKVALSPGAIRLLVDAPDGDRLRMS
jgi:DNA-binding NarL/FixJ family response regulator